MTNEEIDKLEAGPEIDALIAEKVMGWYPMITRAYKRDHSHFLGGHYQTREQCMLECAFDMEPVLFWGNGTGSTFGKTEDNWHPSLSISDAWEVAHSHACESAHKFSVECEHSVWLASVSGLYEAEAEAAPLAICRAALKATLSASP